MILIGVVVVVAVLLLWMMEMRFKALSFDVLEKNSKQFLNLAESVMQPLREQQQMLEEKRSGAYAALSQQITSLVQAEAALRMETTKLSTALKSTQARGSWGEVHLRRVVELAGLLPHCDFIEQKTLESKLRPDVIVQLPGEKQIAIDAKAPLAAYLEMDETDDEPTRKKKLQDHAQLLRKHMRELGSKNYWKELSSAPEFVILFLPAEAFFSAALQADPLLIEAGADSNVVVATPTTLIAILRAVAHGWKQESIAKNAAEIAELGQELFDRVSTLTDHFGKVGRSLSSAVDAYNQSLASIESRVLVSARKLGEKSSQRKELPPLEPLEKIIK